MARRISAPLFILCLLICLVCICGPVEAEVRYTITNLGNLGGSETHATAMNSGGQIVGYASNSGGNMHAFLWDTGVLTDLGTLYGGPESRATAISDSGVVTGTSVINYFGQSRAFVRENGALVEPETKWHVTGGDWTPRDISSTGTIVGGATSPVKFTLDGFEMFLGTTQGTAYATNDRGTIVGTKGSSPHAFTYRNGTSSDLGPGKAVDVNDLDVAVGSRPSGMDTRAVIWSSGVGTDIPLLPNTASNEARGINHTGQVVGWSGNGLSLSSHAFIWENGTSVDLNSLIAEDTGWSLNCAYAINDNGWIVGDGIYEGNQRAFLLIPVVPEPSGLLALGIGMTGIMGFLARYRRV